MADGKLLESWGGGWCCILQWCLGGGATYYLLGLHISEAGMISRSKIFQIVVHSHFSISGPSHAIVFPPKKTSNIAFPTRNDVDDFNISTSKPPHLTAQATIESAAFQLSIGSLWTMSDAWVATNGATKRRLKGQECIMYSLYNLFYCITNKVNIYCMLLLHMPF